MFYCDDIVFTYFEKCIYKKFIRWRWCSVFHIWFAFAGMKTAIMVPGFKTFTTKPVTFSIFLHSTFISVHTGSSHTKKHLAASNIWAYGNIASTNFVFQIINSTNRLMDAITYFLKNITYFENGFCLVG